MQNLLMKFEKNLVGVNRIRNKDIINQLPNCLLCEILLYLSTKDLVKTSVLCRKWRYLWKSVPKLDLTIDSIIGQNRLDSLDKFIKLKGDLCLQRVKLKYYKRFLNSQNKTWINSVIQKTIQHLDVEIDTDRVKIPPTIYTSCERLVSLRLCRVSLPKLPESVSLPCLKIMDLEQIKLVDSLDIEMLISVCPSLETFTTDRMYGVKVSSQSLLSFCLSRSYFRTIKIKEVVLQTPKLKSLKLNYLIVECITINDMSSIVTLNLTGLQLFDVNYPRLLTVISCVRDLTISFDLLQNIQYEVLRSKSKLKFDNVSTLRVDNIITECWKDFTIVLESCPNLRSLFLASIDYLGEINMSDVPQCVSSSLELVEIDKGYCRLRYMKKLGSYFMKNSAVLKKFTLRVDHIKPEVDLIKLKEFFTSSRRSKACEVIVNCARCRIH